MSDLLQNYPLGECASLRVINQSRFKTASISASLMLPLREEAVSRTAVLPFLLKRGCAKYPDFTALSRKRAMLYGASLHSDVSRLGDSLVFEIGISFINDRYIPDEKISAQCAELLRDIIFEPVLEDGVFRDADFEAARRLLREHIDAQSNDKRAYALRRCVELMCAGEPYGIYPFGTRAQAESLTAAEAAEGWRNAINNSHIQLTAVGDITPESVQSGFSEAFSGRTGIAELPGTIVTGKADSVREYTETADVQQSKLVIGLRTPEAESSGDTFASRLMCACLGGTPHSRLFLNVREKLSLCYYCSSQYNRQKGIVLIQSGLERGNVSRAREEIAAQIESIKAGELTRTEIEHAKLSLRDSFIAVNDSPATLEKWYCSQALDRETLTPEQAAERICSVTAEQVTAAAQALTADTVYLLTGKEEA